MILQWMSSAVAKGLDVTRTPSYDGQSSIADIIGPILLNLAVTFVVPSWVNIKSKDVNVQKSVWFSMLLMVLFYVSSGIIGTFFEAKL